MPPPTRPRASRSSLWKHRSFLFLWSAQTTSALGSRITRTAIPVIAVLAVDGSPFELGLLSALTVGPGAVVGLLLGGAVDRARKRPVLIAADVARALLVLTVPVAAWLGALTMWQLYGVAAAIGAATALFQIADNAYLPALVDRSQLVEANAKLEATDSAAEVVGPGVAGVLIDAITAPFAMVVDAASYVVSALFLGRIQAPETPAVASPTDSLSDDVRAGFAACWNEPRVRPLLLASAVTTLCGGFFFALYMIYTLDTLALSPGYVGVIIGVGGVGALFGALLVPWLLRRMPVHRAMLLCLAAGQTAALFIPLSGRWPSAGIALLVLHQLVGDGFLVAFQIQAVSERQAALPLDMLARASAAFTVVGSVLLPLGALLAGLAGEAFGVRNALWIGVVGGLLAPLCLLGAPPARAK